MIKLISDCDHSREHNIYVPVGFPESTVNTLAMSRTAADATSSSRAASERVAGSGVHRERQRKRVNALEVTASDKG
jgi:hypothetical protein